MDSATAVGAGGGAGGTVIGETAVDSLTIGGGGSGSATGGGASAGSGFLAIISLGGGGGVSGDGVITLTMIGAIRAIERRTGAYSNNAPISTA